MSNKLYDILNKVSRIVVPVVSFLMAICTIWGLPYGEQITATATAFNTLLGGLLVISSSSYKKLIKELQDKKYSLGIREEENDG